MPQVIGVNDTLLLQIANAAAQVIEHEKIKTVWVHFLTQSENNRRIMTLFITSYASGDTYSARNWSCCEA